MKSTRIVPAARSDKSELGRARRTSQALLLFLAASLSLSAQQIRVSDVSISFITHSSAHVSFRSTGPWRFQRTRIGMGIHSCEAMNGGYVQSNSGDYLTGGLSPGPQHEDLVTDLQANTLYEVCPEGSADAAKWFGGTGASFTTLPLPAVHPALPQMAAIADTTMPSLAGVKPVFVQGGNCKDLHDKIVAAVANEKTSDAVAGLVILKAGEQWVCNTYLAVDSPDVVSLTSASFDSKTVSGPMAYAITSRSHGLKEGSQIVWTKRSGNGGYPGNLPGSTSPVGGSANPGATSTPVIQNQPVWVHVLDANHFSVYHGASYPKGNLWTYGDSGSGIISYAPYPRKLKDVIVRTSTPDEQFAPEKTHISKAWISKMPSLLYPRADMGVDGPHDCMLRIGQDYESADFYLISHIRFVGINFGTEPDPFTEDASDNKASWYLMQTASTADHIIFDRCLFHGKPGAGYSARLIGWNGSHLAIIDSDFYDGGYGRPQSTVKVHQ